MFGISGVASLMSRQMIPNKRLIDRCVAHERLEFVIVQTRVRVLIDA